MSAAAGAFTEISPWRHCMRRSRPPQRSSGQSTRDPPCPQAWLLAQHRRNRIVFPDEIAGRRIGDLGVLSTELDAWAHATNTDERQVAWRFTTVDSRIKIRHLYPITYIRQATSLWCVACVSTG